MIITLVFLVGFAAVVGGLVGVWRWKNAPLPRQVARGVEDHAALMERIDRLERELGIGEDERQDREEKLRGYAERYLKAHEAGVKIEQMCEFSEREIQGMAQVMTDEQRKNALAFEWQIAMATWQRDA